MDRKTRTAEPPLTPGEDQGADAAKDPAAERTPESEAPEAPFAEPVVVPIEDSIDLHPFSPKDIPSVVEEYLEECRKAGIYEARLIHGRGKGIQRRIIRSLLEKHPHVLSVDDAPAEAGGWGATIVRLRQPV